MIGTIESRICNAMHHQYSRTCSAHSTHHIRSNSCSLPSLIVLASVLKKNSHGLSLNAPSPPASQLNIFAIGSIASISASVCGICVSIMCAVLRASLEFGLSTLHLLHGHYLKEDGGNSVSIFRTYHHFQMTFENFQVQQC